MIPSGRLVALASVPLVLSAAWVFAPGVAPAIVALDALLVVVAVVDALRGRRGLAIRREVDEVQSVGRSFPVALVVSSPGGGPVDAVVGDGAPGRVEGLPARVTLPADAPVVVRYEATVHHRGHHAFGPAAVRWRTPWGLWWRQRRLALDGAVRVHPDFTHLRRGGLEAREDERRIPVRARRKPGGENEFQRLRQYVPGDPYRHIDWKATARARRFITREFGQESNQNVIFLLDAGRTMTQRMGELTAFDHALNAALVMGHAALRHGDRVGLMAFDGQVRRWIPPRGGTRVGSELIRATYDLFPSLDEADHAAAFRHLAGRVRRRSLVVLLTAVTDRVSAETTSAVVRAMATRHLPLCVWLRDPGLDARVAAPPLGDGLYEGAAAASLLAERADALGRLRERGALVVDGHPDRLSARLLSRYLEVKARRLL